MKWQWSILLFFYVKNSYKKSQIAWMAGKNTDDNQQPASLGPTQVQSDALGLPCLWTKMINLNFFYYYVGMVHVGV